MPMKYSNKYILSINQNISATKVMLFDQSADRQQTENLTRYLAGSDEPAYLRIGRNAVPDIYSDQEIFESGKAKKLRQG
jgi:transketolase C-terminal domain/subunit